MKKSAVAICICVLFLLSFGLVMLYSASYPYALNSKACGYDPYYYVQHQLTWIGLGLIALVVASRVDYAVWRRLAFPLLILTVVLLALVITPGIRKEVNGSYRWLKIGGTTILQPSELAKIAVLLMLAHYLDHWQRVVQEVRAKKFFLFRQKFSELGRGFAAPMLIMGVPVMLIFCEVDIGTGTLISLASFFVMLLGGVRWWLLAASYVPAMAGMVYYLCNNEVRWNRIVAFLHLEEHKLDIGMQQWQGKLAFGTGGLTGVGIAESRSKENYLPFAYNDFIAPIIGEELGLIGMMALLAVFVTLILVCVRVCMRARELYGFLLGMGIVCLIGFQTLINLAVVTSLMPNKGLPLPFISYGGSNLCVLLGCVGLLLSIARHAGAHEPIASRPVRNPFGRLTPTTTT